MAFATCCLWRHREPRSHRCSCRQEPAPPIAVRAQWSAQPGSGYCLDAAMGDQRFRSRGQDLTPAALRPRRPGNLDRLGIPRVFGSMRMLPAPTTTRSALASTNSRCGADPATLRDFSLSSARGQTIARVHPTRKAYPAPTAPAKAGPATRSERAQQPSVKAEIGDFDPGFIAHLSGKPRSA